MNDIENAISRLEKQRSAIDRALLALREISGPNTSKAQPVSQSKSRRRRLSPEGRRRIIEATKKRFALTTMCTNPNTTLSASINNSVVILPREPCGLPPKRSLCLPDRI